MSRGRFVAEVAQVFGLRVVLVLIVLAADIVAARTLGPEGRGLLAVLTLTPVLLATVTAGGLDVALNQLGHKEPVRLPQLFNTVLLLALGPVTLACTALVMDLGGVRSRIFSGLGTEVSELALVAVTIVPAEVLFVLAGMLVMTRGFPLRFAGMRLLRRSVILVAIVAAALITEDRNERLHLITGATAGAILLSGLAGVLMSRSASWGLFDRPRAVLGVTARAYPARVTDRLQTRIIVLIVAALGSGSIAGQLVVGMAIAEMILFVSNSAMTVLYSRNVGAHGSTHRLALKAMFPLAILIGTAIGAVSQVALPLVYGEAFRPTVLLVWLLIPGAVGGALVQTVMPFLVQTHRESLASRAQAVGLATGLVVVVVGIDAWGGRAGAIAQSCAYLVSFLLIGLGVAAGEGIRLRDLLLPSADDIARTRDYVTRITVDRRLP